jgi:hypothetical protein
MEQCIKICVLIFTKPDGIKTSFSVLTGRMNTNKLLNVLLAKELSFHSVTVPHREYCSANRNSHTAQQMLLLVSWNCVVGSWVRYELRILSVCVVGFSAFSSSKGNCDYSARVDLVQSVKKSSKQCVCVCAVVLSGSCVFLKLWSLQGKDYWMSAMFVRCAELKSVCT